MIILSVVPAIFGSAVLGIACPTTEITFPIELSGVIVGVVLFLIRVFFNYGKEFQERGRNFMIAPNLDKVMKDRCVKLKELAVKIGLTDENVSNIKTGKISAIRFSTLNALCKELDC